MQTLPYKATLLVNRDYSKALGAFGHWNVLCQSGKKGHFLDFSDRANTKVKY